MPPSYMCDVADAVISTPTRVVEPRRAVCADETIPRPVAPVSDRRDAAPSRAAFCCDHGSGVRHGMLVVRSAACSFVRKIAIAADDYLMQFNARALKQIGADMHHERHTRGITQRYHFLRDVSGLLTQRLINTR